MCPPSILIVEPWANLRLLYSEELETEGYEVTACAQMAQLPELRAADAAVDLVLVDGGSSWTEAEDIAIQVWEAFPHAVLVVHVASALYAIGGVPPMIDAFMEKSSDLSELKRIVRELICERESSRD